MKPTVIQRVPDVHQLLQAMMRKDSDGFFGRRKIVLLLAGLYGIGYQKHNVRRFSSCHSPSIGNDVPNRIFTVPLL